MEYEYRHTPLTGDDDIRILHVQADLSINKTAYSFQTISLNNPQEYIAISYAWEDPTIVKSVLCDDDGLLGLNRTLSNLLDSLVQRFETLNVWIDALCINQDDPIEKAHQVKMMGKVYSSASKVLVWLGEGTANTALAFSFMATRDPQKPHKDREPLLGSDPGESDDVPQAVSISLWELLERPWFRRVWVIQEVTLGNNVFVLCGNDMIPFSNLQTGILSLWTSQGTESMFDIENTAYQALWCANRLFETRDMFKASGSRGIKYERLLESTFHCLASDSRDFIFALQGIAKETDILLQPDYMVSTESVFRDSAAIVLCRGKSLDLLALAGTGRRYSYVDLPSWVPDFRQNPYSEPLWTSDKAGWNAGGELHKQPVITPDGMLSINAIKFDTVAAQGPRILVSLFHNLRDDLEYLLSMGDSLNTYPSGESWSDVVWKSLIEGLDHEHVLVAPDFVEHFHTLRKDLETIPQKLSGDLDQMIGNSSHITGNPYMRALSVHADGERTFITSRGYLGMANPDVRVGDTVCVVPGCRTPLILRPYPYILPGVLSQSVETQYTIVAWSYVHGIMLRESLTERYESENVILR